VAGRDFSIVLLTRHTYMQGVHG